MELKGQVWKKCTTWKIWNWVRIWRTQRYTSIKKKEKKKQEYKYNTKRMSPTIKYSKRESAMEHCMKSRKTSGLFMRCANWNIGAPSKVVGVKGGMSLRHGVWRDLRNGIIMRNVTCRMHDYAGCNVICSVLLIDGAHKICPLLTCSSSRNFEKPRRNRGVRSRHMSFLII